MVGFGGRCLGGSSSRLPAGAVAPPAVSRFLRIAIAALSATIQALNVALAQEEVQELYAKAQSAQAAGDLSTAAGSYEEIVLLLPDLAEAHANLGSIYYQIGDDRKAVSSLEKAIDLKPNLAAPYFFLGVIARRQNDHARSIQYLESYSRIDPANSIVPVYLGEAYYATGRYPAAASEFWKSASNSDFRPDAHYFLSRVYSKLAEEALERLAAEHPGSFFVKLALGHFHEGRRNWKEAEKAYGEAQRLRPDAEGLEARLTWIGSAEARGSPPLNRPPLRKGNLSLLELLYNPPSGREIDSLLEASRKRLAASGEAATGQEAMYEQVQEYQVASYLAARWIGENDRGSYRARLLRAQLHELRGEADEAVSEYRAALRLRPGLQEVHFAIGTLLWSLSRLDEALPELQAELRINPNHPEAHYEIADILQVLGRREEAKAHLVQAIRFAPQMVAAHLALERIYFAEGRLEEGLRHLEDAARLDPADPAPHYRMATVYRRLGRAEESQRALAEFQRLQRE